MLPNHKLRFTSQDSVLFESSPEVIIFLDLQGKIQAINSRIYDWIKIKPEQMVGKSVFDLAIMTPESRELVKKKFRLRLNQKIIEPYEIQVFDRSGNLVVGRVSGRLLEEKGRPVGVLIMVANVTQLEMEMQQRLFRALESESRYSSLFENMSSAVVICDYDEEDGEYLIKNVNRAFLKTEKTTKKACLGESLCTFLKQKLGGELCHLVTKAWKTEIPQPFILESSGKESRRYLKGTVYRLQTGELTVIYDDVTQSLFDQEALKKNEIKFRTTFNNANDAMFMMKGNHFIDCNKKTLQMFGLTDKSEIVDHTPIEFSPAKQPDGMSSGRKALQYIHRAESGRPQRFYWQHLRKDGSVFDVEVSLNRLYLHDEQYLLAIVRDVTEESAIKHLLSASETRFRSVVENAQAVIFVIDQDGKFTLSEGKKLSLLGLKPGQVVGMSAYEIYKDYPEIIKAIKISLSGKTHRTIIKVQEVYFDIFYSPLKEESTGKVTSIIGMAVDVTESEKFKENLMELDQSKSEFISTASHQLRSPLANIRWGLEILLTDPLVQANDSLKNQMENVHGSSLKVINLVNNLLNTSRIYSKKLVNKPSKIKVLKTLTDLVVNFEIDRSHLDLQVIWRIDEDLELKVDPSLFGAVLANLLGNAIKYNKKNGVVVVFAKEKADRIEISIANTGKPIPKSEHSQIFERFFRGSNVTMEFEGTGLGLYISKSYMEFLGGEISFESGVRFGDKNLNGEQYLGTIFHLTFPK